MSGLWFPAPLFDSPRSRLTARRWVVLLLVASLLAGFGVAMPAAAPQVLAVIDDGSGQGIWFVGPQGRASGACAESNLDFTTGGAPFDSSSGSIQRAVAAASSGDTIFLCDYTYELTSGITITGKDLTFAGESTAATIVDGKGTVGLFDAGNNGNATFIGLTLRNGYAIDGGAVRAASVKTYGVSFVGNIATSRGGAVFAPVVHSRFGTYLRNRAGMQGGAIYADNAVGDVVGGTFQENSAGTAGGAIWSTNAFSITGGDFIDNTGGSSGGGAVYLVTSTSLVDGGRFTGNTTIGNGGAILAEGRPTIRNARFEGNRAVRGGGIYGANGLTLDSNLFQGNSATRGGGVGVNGPLTLRNSTFVDNSTNSGMSATGAGLAFLNSGAGRSISESTFVRSYGSHIGWDASQSNVVINVTVTHSLFVDGDCSLPLPAMAVDLGGNVSTHSSCRGTPATIEAIRLGDGVQPDGTLPLLKGSVAIDPTSGIGLTCSVTQDQRGEPRPSLARCDAGAYEYQADDFDQTSGISITASLRGVAIAPGQTLSSGDAVTVDAVVSLTTGDDADLTAGVVIFKYCAASVSPLACGVDGTTFSTRMVIRGDADLTGGASAQLSGLIAGRSYRLGALFVIPGGKVGGSEVTEGTATFDVISAVTLTWDATAGVLAGSGGSVPLRAYARDASNGNPAAGCRIGFRLENASGGDFGTQQAITDASGGAAVTRTGLPDDVYLVTVTTGDGCLATPTWGVVTVALTAAIRGASVVAAAGRHFVSGTTGTSVSFGLRLRSSSTTNKQTKLTTTTTSLAFIWVSSDGWLLASSSSGDVTTGAAPWAKEACPSSVSDGITSGVLARGYVCGRLAFGGQPYSWDGSIWAGSIGSRAFTARFADGGTSRKGDAMDWFGLESLDGDSSAPISPVRPLRLTQTSTVLTGRILIL